MTAQPTWQSRRGPSIGIDSKVRESVRSITSAGLLLVFYAAGCAGAEAEQVRLSDDFAGTDGFVASEHQPAAGSPWTMTSGTLYRSEGAGWSGSPDPGGAPGLNGSAVFRMVSVNRGFTNIDLTLRLDVESLVETARTPARSYDGAHIWVRYRSDKELYAVSVDRRDATMVIKKKCPGGVSNGGTYWDLASPVPDVPIPLRRWQEISVSVRDLADGSVAVDASRDGIRLSAVDTGVGCPPLRGGGGVGIRGDNAELRFDDIVVTDISP